MSGLSAGCITAFETSSLQLDPKHLRREHRFLWEITFVRCVGKYMRGCTHIFQTFNYRKTNVTKAQYIRFPRSRSAIVYKIEIMGATTLYSYCIKYRVRWVSRSVEIIFNSSCSLAVNRFREQCKYCLICHSYGTSSFRRSIFLFILFNSRIVFLVLKKRYYNTCSRNIGFRR